MKFYTCCDELCFEQSCDTVPLIVLQVPALRNVKFYTCCDEPYLDITFNITMRRKVGGSLLEGFTLYFVTSQQSNLIRAESGLVQPEPELVNIEGGRNRLFDGLVPNPVPDSGILFWILHEFVLIYLT